MLPSDLGDAAVTGGGAVVMNTPPYAIGSRDHGLRLAQLLLFEGALSVTRAEYRVAVSPSTAHRLSLTRLAR